MTSFLPRETRPSPKNVLTDAFIEYLDLTNENDNLKEAMSTILNRLKDKRKLKETVREIDETLFNHNYGNDKGAFNHILNKINKELNQETPNKVNILEYLGLFGDLSILLKHLATYDFLEDSNKHQSVVSLFSTFLRTLGQCFSNIETDKELDDEQKQLFYNSLTVSYIRVADEVALFKRQLEKLVGYVYEDAMDMKKRLNNKKENLQKEQEKVFTFGVKKKDYEDDIADAEKGLLKFKEEIKKVDGDYNKFLSSFTNNKDSGCYNVILSKKYNEPKEHKDRKCLCILTVMMMNNSELDKLAETLLLQIITHYNEYYIVLRHGITVVDTLINSNFLKNLEKDNQQKIIRMAEKNETRDFDTDVVNRLIVYDPNITCKPQPGPDANDNNVCQRNTDHNRLAKVSAKDLLGRVITLQPTDTIVDDATRVVETTPVVHAVPLVEATNEDNISVAQPIFKVNKEAFNKLSNQCKSELNNALDKSVPLPQPPSQGGNKSQKKRKMRKKKAHSRRKAKKTIKKDTRTKQQGSRRTHKKKLNHKKR